MRSRRSLRGELYHSKPQLNRSRRQARTSKIEQPKPDTAEESILSTESVGAMADKNYDDEEPPHRAKRNRPRQFRDFYIPNEYNQGEATMGPDIGATQFEIKASVINMLSSFHGIENDDPYRHLDEFIDVCKMVRITNIGDDALRLRLFFFSLKDKARHWLKSLTSKARIQTWEELQREFLKRYFPIGKTNQFRCAITSFVALEGETFYQSWERMKELLRRCPHHQVPKW
ncbi:unnamed protein product [Victoria cruziana]